MGLSTDDQGTATGAAATAVGLAWVAAPLCRCVYGTLAYTVQSSVIAMYTQNALRLLRDDNLKRCYLMFLVR